MVPLNLKGSTFNTKLFTGTRDNFFIVHLHNEDLLYNMTINYEMLRCANIIPNNAKSDILFYLCSYSFGHIME